MEKNCKICGTTEDVERFDFVEEVEKFLGKIYLCDKHKLEFVMNLKKEFD